MVTFESLKAREDKIGIVGLGYVGLPLAVHLSAHFDVVGFDLKADRVQELRNGVDRTLEVDGQALAAAKMQYTCNPEDLAACRLIIVAVPTPIDQYNIPDLSPLRGASITTGRQLRKGACVVFESTVFPGATEEICVPLLEQESGLAFGKDFTVGYSPERINPGDKINTLDTIIKIVSGSEAATAQMLARVYGEVVKAGIHKASSIKVAEAAKVIENTQRDLNIALMNELAMIFDMMGINTIEVLEAAGTKWNFLPFRPGLVGGHCIGVDPYYLTFKAEATGYHPEMILAGRLGPPSAVRRADRTGRRTRRRPGLTGLVSATFESPEQCARAEAERRADDRPSDDVGGVMDADIGAADADDGRDRPPQRRQAPVVPRREERGGEHRRRGVARRERGRRGCPYG